MVTLTHGETVATDEMKARFIKEYLEDPVIKHVTKKLSMERRTFYHWLKNDKEFVKKYEEARGIILVFLEDEAYRRAVTGISKPIYQGGMQVGTIREYSDVLLKLLLQANDPAKYRENGASLIVNNNFQKTEIAHIHSNIPLASSEDTIMLELNKPEDLPFEEIPKSNPDDLLQDLQ